MSTVIFVAVETEPLARFELGEAALVADLLRVLSEGGANVAQLLVFKHNQPQTSEHHHPLHGHGHPIFHVH